MKKIFIFGLLTVCLLIMSVCSDPSSSDDKYIVKTLIDEYWGQGQYTEFWDGTDDNNKPLPAGTYYVRLWTKNYSNQIKIEAQDGTFRTTNDSTVFFPTPTFITLLEQNHPNPFRILEGTNIPFQLAESGTIELTIRNHE